jgi:CubicO group peptidase (beta-lactamase class C family)
VPTSYRASRIATALLLGLLLVLPGASRRVRAADVPLTVAPAVELRFQPIPGTVHQLQSSTDLVSWTNVGNVILGPADPVSRFAPADDPNARFFRLAPSPVRDLGAELATIRNQYTVPALACAVVRSNRVVGVGYVGVRKHGVAEPVTLEDRWHHGSITKSMTATLAGILVDEGLLGWQTRLADVFPAEAAAMHADWKSVTLEQLLANRGGAPEDLGPSGIWAQIWNHPGTPREARRFLLQKLTVLPAAAKPGTTYLYSNAGFALAGAMLEQAAGIPWEQLLTRKLFQPLGLASAGFGVPATPRHIDQPWGHTFSGTTPVPVEPGTNADNPPAIGPAATAHASLLDLAAYAAFHVSGELGRGSLMTPATFRKLHTDVAGQGYALGWSVGERPWAGGRTLNHTGSNNQWYTNIWLAPNRDFAMVIVTNIGGDRAFRATDAVAGRLIALFL